MKLWGTVLAPPDAVGPQWGAPTHASVKGRNFRYGPCRSPSGLTVDEEELVAIVVGYIPTKEGAAALTRASEEALLRKSKLVIINSHRDGSGDTGNSAQLDALGTELQGKGIEVEVRQLVRGNEPSEDLIGVAEEIDAELIVIGLRRRTPVGKLILGSNAQRILLDAPCPVLAVKS